MAIMEYGIGGNEVKIDASEAIAAIPENRTLIVEKLTSDEPINPEVVTGLTSIEQVFEHYKPQIDVEFENAEGQPVNETFHFRNTGEFDVKNMTKQSSFLSDVNTKKNFFENQTKQLRSNKVLQRVLENPEAKQAFMTLLESIKAEIQATDNE
ncbi:hypothetical protein [Dysgonomonas sp. 511]|uniref:hypothetical protein n=1 Tax=Dysgonomonas sp. 511 TaxID=2302930 RepID=UPI0013D72923|nr:hypothetical protein [Dysgonomonas sp. 511]NDV78489.1 hypothetical protein [Dysgonomonas sp. 511]